MAIINSNRREEHHVIIGDINHNGDEDKNLLANANEAHNEVSINSPNESNETENITTNEGENSDMNKNVIIVPQINQNISYLNLKVAFYPPTMTIHRKIIMTMKFLHALATIILIQTMPIA